MSSVRFVFPKLKLEQLIHAPGGITVADALSQANANLETLKPRCREELLALLEAAEGVFADPGADAVAELYALSARGIGAGAVCGAPDVDQALGSFCDLLDHLQQQGRMEPDAIGVCLRSWRMLMDTDLPRPGAAAILDGLRKVSARFAAEAQP
jgi:hypothetical protein